MKSSDEKFYIIQYVATNDILWCEYNVNKHFDVNKLRKFVSSFNGAINECKISFNKWYETYQTIISSHVQ